MFSERSAGANRPPRGQPASLSEIQSEREPESRLLEAEAEMLRAEVRSLSASLGRALEELDDRRMRSRSWRFLASTAWRRIVEAFEVSSRFTAKGRARREMRERVDRVLRSGLFDTVFYLRGRPSKANSVEAAIRHYLEVGGRDRRDPHPLFDSLCYIQSLEPGAIGSFTPLEHYLLCPADAEGRPNALFDGAWYRKSNPAVGASGTKPLVHYVRFGSKEGRRPHPEFDPRFYRQTYADVRRSRWEPLAHFLRVGAAEGRLRHRDQRRRPGREAVPTADIGVGAGADARLSISILVPTFDSKPEHLRSLLRSVKEQTYPHWQLCVCDDGSSRQETLEALRRLAAEEPRVKLVFSEENRGIAHATNAALALADGAYIAFLDHDDELAPEALMEMARAIGEDPGVDVLYSDEDKLDENGRSVEPFRKPDWSPEYLRSVMYVGHLLVVRRSLLEAVGGCDPAFDGIQDFELMLRLSERTDRIRHLSSVLYHWRKSASSLAAATDAKRGIERLQVEAVCAHLERLKLPAKAEPHPRHPHRLRIVPRPRETYPRVSIVIPTKDNPGCLERCLDTLLGVTRYPDLEVIVVDTGSSDPRALSLLDRPELVRLDDHGPFNYSRANNKGVARATGDFVVLLNDDTEVRQADWLEQMLYYFSQPDVAAVGPLLVFPDEKVQHAGVVLGLRGTADHVMRGRRMDEDGYAGSLSCAREVSAVTAACLMVRRSDYQAVGGLVEEYGLIYQDVDLCLRLRAQGKRIVYTPNAVLLHHESASRGRDYNPVDRLLLLDEWREVLAAGDPYFNRAFARDAHDYVLVPASSTS